MLRYLICKSLVHFGGIFIKLGIWLAGRGHIDISFESPSDRDNPILVFCLSVFGLLLFWVVSILVLCLEGSY